MNSSEFLIVNVEPKTAITIKEKSSEAELKTLFTGLFNELGNLMRAQSLEAASPSFSIYYSYSSDLVELEAGIPVSGKPKPEGRIEVIQTYGGKAIMLKHTGPYENLHSTWNRLREYVKKNKLEVTGYPFEVYVVGPRQISDSSKWLTEIYFPIN